jgi:hypothetical protein
MNIVAHRADEFAHRGAPITLPAPAMEIATFVMDHRADFVRVAGTVKGDVKEEVSQSAAELQASAKGCHELAFVGRLQKDVTRIELDHSQVSKNRRVGSVRHFVQFVLSKRRAQITQESLAIALRRIKGKSRKLDAEATSG